MNNIFNYLILSSVYLVTFYLFYTLFLSRDTNFSRNRIYLLTTATLSLLLPLVRIPISTESAAINPLFQGIINISEVIVGVENPEQTSLFGSGILLMAYLSGAIISITLLLIKTAGIYKIVTRSASDNNIVYINNSNISGFSALGYVFLYTGLNEDEKSRILQHEQSHVEHKHHFDLLLIKITSALMWFNPVIYLYERSLRAVHEYQADKVLLEHGNSITSYQQLILNQAFNTHFFAVQNGFSGRSLIKKRIIMMTKKPSGKISGVKVLLILPVIASLIFLFSCTNSDSDPVDLADQPASIENLDPSKGQIEAADESKEEAFVVVEQMPTFNGGDINYFRDWVQRNVKYPKIAAENGIQGKVYVMFVVTSEGKIRDAQILRGVDPSLDDEVLRVVNSSPDWVPGEMRQKPVDVKFSITVNFQLQ
jgi:TonB family protein